MKVIHHPILPISIYEEILPNGMKVALVPRQGFNTIKTILDVRFGLKDEANLLYIENGWRGLPQGTAHFLEHRIFESRGEQLMRYFAQHGASINAATGTLSTQYYFSTIRDYPELLTNFLKFIQHYSDNDEGVKKEAGIIQREYVRRFESEAAKIEQMLMKVTYPDHHLSKEILGTESTIQHMTKEDLGLAFQHYYRSSNMTLVIVGKIDVEKTLHLIQDIQNQFPNREPLPVQTISEIKTIKGEHVYHEKAFDISLPEDHFFIKFPPFSSSLSFEQRNRESTIMNLLRRMLLNSNAPLYLKWQSDKLLESSLSGAFYHVKDSYAMWNYQAHTKHPQALFNALKMMFLQPWDDALMKALFESLRNSSIGGSYTDINSISGLANAIVDSASKQEPYLTNLTLLPTIQYEEIKKKYYQIGVYDLEYFHIDKQKYII